MLIENKSKIKRFSAERASTKRGIAILSAVSFFALQPLAVFAQDDVSIRTLAPLDSSALSPAQTTSRSESPTRANANSGQQSLNFDSITVGSSSPRSAPASAGRNALSFTAADPNSLSASDSLPSLIPARQSTLPPETDSPYLPAPAKSRQSSSLPASTESGYLPEPAKSAQTSNLTTPTESSLPPAADKAKQIAQAGPEIAQSSSSTSRRNRIPGTVGTIQIHKPFKMFVTEQLIHNISFRDTPVREVIAEIARRGNLNIIIDKSVTGKITGDLRDVTLNEAMDSVLASAGLQHRTLDNNTVIVASLQAAVQLGLNRPTARVFKLSYAHPYDVAMILSASVFNRGMLPNFINKVTRGAGTGNSTDSKSERQLVGGGPDSQGDSRARTTVNTTEGPTQEREESLATETTTPDTIRTVRGASRMQLQEGVGFNNAATDPGSQQIRSFQEINTDYPVDQNGGGAIVIPDTKNRQVMVVGTQDDLQVAEEAIRMLDRRPKQIHLQASLVELNNQAIRELGANLNVQGLGLSSSVLGNAAAPLTQFLPGLGSTFQNAIGGAAPPSVPFSSSTTPSGNIGGAFTGLVGTLLNAAPVGIANVAPVTQSQTGFNFLTLSKAAGGASNIATWPSAMNINLNLLLQTNKAKLIANPSVVVADDTETLITIANEVVHKVTSTVSLGVVTSNVELTKAGIFLNVLPRITEDGFVTMRLRPQVSTPLGPAFTVGSTTAPTTVTLLSVREIMSQQVRVKDGQTLVLGGLFTEQEAAQLSKVPYLAEAPVLGALFRNSLKGRNRTELMLLMTPKVVEEDPTQVSDSPNNPTM